jgi:hypothetical protein
MKRITLILGIGVAIVLITLGAYVGTMRNKSDAGSNSADTAVKARVEEFGSKLKNVALLSDKKELANQIEINYSEYLTPELLASWKNDPTLALGRNTSSPSPDRIEIASITKQSESTYIVQASVIETTSADAPGTSSASYPVIIVMEKRGDIWLVSSVTKSDYNQ